MAATIASSEHHQSSSPLRSSKDIATSAASNGTSPVRRAAGSAAVSDGTQYDKNALPMPPELFAMIGENTPMIALSRISRSHREGKRESGVSWAWKQFDNPARNDGLRLSHWERTPSLDVDSTAHDQLELGQEAPREYQYAKYNTSTNVYSYSYDEYLSHLRDETGNWSREETDYLFGLCHDYDLRWFVIKDRWNFGNHTAEGESNARSVDNAVAGASSSINGQKQTSREGSTAQANGMQTDVKGESAQSQANDSTQDNVKTGDSAAQTSDPVSASTGAGPFASPAPAVPTEVATHRTEQSKYKDRTIEELKDRYYSVCRRLIRARPASDENAKQALLQSYAFDKDREAARKHHLQHLITKGTSQHLEEEEFLYIESRRLEQQYSKVSKERDDLWRILCGVGPQSTSALALNSPFLSATARENAANAAGLSNKKRRRGELDMLEDPNNTGQKVTNTTSLPQLTPAQDEQYGVTRFDASTPASSVIRPSGVYLRSSKPPQLKTSLAPKITAALQEQSINMRLCMPTRQNMEKLEALVSAITSLLDCKKQVERAEYEVKVLKTRKDAAMRIEEEDRAIKAQEEEEARKQKDREGSGATPAMEVDN